jgi:phospholipid/cholesterol/gamma-HCH transport system substrate-binding protein
VLRNAVPTATALARLATSAKPVGTTLDNSADNIIAVVDNWSKAVQFRDGLSHIFRGEASVSPDLLQSVIDRLTAKASKKSKAAAPATSKPAVAPILPTAPSGKTPSVVPKLPVKLPDVAKTVGGLLDKVTGLLPKVSAGQSDQRHGDRSNGLLDFLLGSGSR